MFTLINLPYALDALEPVISKQTLEFHHGKHLQTYVDNLNKLLTGTGLEEKTLEEIIVAAAASLSAPTGNLKAIFNNAGQVLNHNLYFTQFTAAPHSGSSPHSGLSSPQSNATPHSGLDPESPLAKQIARQWGTLDAFKSDFESKGIGLFGSGWVWLQANSDGELSIAQYSNADNPVAHGLKPILTFDVWEHAYYLDYQNRRAAHLQALWQIADWCIIEMRYTSI
jgi:Fe-Mn family superoxide dismutase